MASSERSARSRRFVARAALALGALALATVAAEIAWRVLRSGGHGPTTNPRYVVHDSLLGWRYRPLARVRHATEDFDVEIAIGASGFREQASMPARAPAVLVLGDSLAFGWGVASADTCAARLEAELGVAVWNLGVSGWGTDQEYLLLRERAFPTAVESASREAVVAGGTHEASGAPDDGIDGEASGVAIAPRVVLVLHCPNDVEEVARSAMYGKAKPFFAGAPEALVLAGVPVPRPWIERVSHLARSVRKHAEERWREPLGGAAVERARAVVVALYSKMDEEARELGARLVVAHAGERWLAVALERAGLPHVDLAPELAAAEREGSIAFAHDPHWNERGHAAAARAIARFLREQALL